MAAALMTADTRSPSATQRIFTGAARGEMFSLALLKDVLQEPKTPREQTQKEIPNSGRSLSWHSHLDQLSKNPKIHQNPVFWGKPFPSNFQSVGFMWELQGASF